MYRASHDTLFSTVERLEAELRELKGLRATPRPRERVLWAVSVVSLLGAILAGTACATTLAHASDAERRFDGARARLERKTHDLASCESFALQELRGEKD